MKKAKELKKFQYRMKKRPTKHELMFMDKLLDCGVEFKNQMILGFYIIDFVIPSKMLIFEIDGDTHNEKTKAYDTKRDKFCEACGFVVIRIKNEDVENYDLGIIDIMPEMTFIQFRSGLAKAMSLKSDSIRYKKTKKVRKKKKRRERYEKIIGEKVFMAKSIVDKYNELQRKEREFNIKMREVKKLKSI